MTTRRSAARRADDSDAARPAEVVRELGPFEDHDHVHGVSFDGRHVWAAVGEAILAVDPESGRVERRLAVPAHAGTAFDGRWLYQIAESRIDRIDPAEQAMLMDLMTRMVEANPQYGSPMRAF